MTAPSCPRCGADLPPGARFCPACGLEFTAAGSAEERKVVTVLFADVTGSTELGERLDPEHLREVMATFFAAMREEIEGEGGTVEKFIGDAVMAAFGVPAAHEDDPARALRAAIRMRERLRAVNDELESTHGVRLDVRVGINTGAVIATPDPAPGEPMVTGDAVNVAARLQAVAEAAAVLVSERTARGTRGFRFGEARAIDLKGKSRPILAMDLLERDEIAAERGIPGIGAPLIGRDDELALLMSIFGRSAREGRPTLVTIYGDAGVGKSRLTAEFVTRVEEDEGAASVRGRCPPYGEGITYWPLAEILKGYAGVLDSDPPELSLDKIRKAGRELLTEDVTADPEKATAALAYTVGVEDPAFAFGSVEPRDLRQEVSAAWRSFFSALALERPVIVIVEDIHWADAALLDLLDELAERVVGPAVFVCPARPELTAKRPGWGGGRGNHSSVALDPLSAEQSERLIRELLEIEELPTRVRGRILERAEGNPFFIEEIVRHLIDESLVVRDGSRWRAVGGIEDIVIPDTVQAVLAARIDLLDPMDKRILQAAAVVGRVFWPGPLRLLTEAVDDDLDHALRSLEDRELILSRLTSSLAGQPEFLFKHVLTRDVAYESLPRRDRGRAHASVASWLERTAGSRVGEFSELLAYHLSAAVDLARDAVGGPSDELRREAVRWLVRASDDVRRRVAIAKAQRLAEEALELAANDLERTDALEMLGEAFLADYSGDLAWRYFREAAFTRARATSPDPPRVARLAALACDVAVRWPGSMRGQLPSEAEVDAVWRLGFEHLPEGDSEERIRILGVRAGWPFAFPADRSEQELEERTASALEAAEIAIRLGLPDRASAAFDQAIGPWLSVGWYGRAVPLWERRAEIVAQLTEILELGDLFAMGGWVHYEVGRYPRALEIAEAGIAKVQGRGPTVEVHVRSWRVAALYRLGRWPEALTEFGLVRELLGDRRDDPPYFATHAFGMAGTIHERRGERVQSDALAGTIGSFQTGYSGRLYPTTLRFLLARGELEHAAALERPPTWRVHAGDALEAEAERVAALADWRQATSLVEAMRRFAEQADAPSVEAFADRLAGRTAVATGDLDRAAELLQRAMERFTTLETPWERALTELDIASLQAGAGARDAADGTIARAAATFEELGDVQGLAAARALRSRS